MPSRFTSVSGLQLPHQPLNDPFTSGIIKPVCCVMSTLNVTGTGGVAQVAEQEFQQTVGRTMAVVPTVKNRFVKPLLVTVQELPGINCSPLLTQLS